MSAYLELSRPFGDVSRWEKVLKRLTLLNKHYPLNSEDCFENVFKFNNAQYDVKQQLFGTGTEENPGVLPNKCTEPNPPMTGGDNKAYPVDTNTWNMLARYEYNTTELH